MHQLSAQIAPQFAWVDALGPRPKRVREQTVQKHSKDHGGGLDAAAARFGGQRADWLDLSTGINPVPYVPDLTGLPADAWSALPDQSAMRDLLAAARRFWNVPEGAKIIAAPGASALIANIPRLMEGGAVSICAPTYNEHAGAFETAGWRIEQSPEHCSAQVIVHPNNPDGRIWSSAELQARFHIIDESFCDVMPQKSLIHRAALPNTIVLKSFGKFWGLAGLRLGFAIGDPALIARLDAMLGPWAVSGPALKIGTDALRDFTWAEKTRARLAQEARTLDHLVLSKGAKWVGGTDLFRLYEVDHALKWQEKLAQHKIWSRIFPYNDKWLRLGLPHPDTWDRVKNAV